MGVFRSDGDYIYLNSSYCEFYIPMEYFDPTVNFSTDMSDKIRTFGFFNVGIFEGGKLKDLRILNLPVIIEIYVYESEIRDVKLSNGEITQCKVLKYNKGAKIMEAPYFEDDLNVKTFLNLMMAGKLPKTLPYSKLMQVWDKNLSMSKVNFGLSSFHRELFLSVMYRNPNDLSEKFSKIACNPGVSDNDYAGASVRQICQYNSTFTAVTFEDIDSMITTSLNKTRTKGNEKESPLEQVIKF